MRSRWIGKVALLAAFVNLSGCLHSAPTYPGSRASGINPADYFNAPCPDFSGIYEGVGTLVEGKNTPQKDLAFYFLFPGGIEKNRTDRDRVRQNHLRPDGPARLVEEPTGDGKHWKHVQVGGRVIEADYAEVRQLGPRSLDVTLGYQSGLIGTYRSDYTDPEKFICKDGKVMSGGPTPAGTRSEFGKTQWFGSFLFYKDERGDLILEREKQLDMNILFVPAGSATSSETYRFRRIPAAKPAS
jgi:hypothetical protein